MKTTHIILAAVLAATSAIQAATAEHKLPAPMPEFKTPEQLAVWRKEMAEKAAAVDAQTAKQANSAPSTSVFYTGKPYVEEAASYAFSFRNYDPELNRWTSADPSGFPDGANNRCYAPVPTGALDSDGLQVIKLSYVTYIETSTISYLGRTFNGGTKTWDNVTVDTDTSSITTRDKGCGYTYEYNSAGAVIGTGHASGSTLSATLSKSDDCHFTVTMGGNESNPLVSLSPGITYETTFSFDLDAGTLSWTGAHDQFPSHQMYIDDTSKYTFSHVTAGTSPSYLLPPWPNATFSGSMTIDKKTCE